MIERCCVNFALMRNIHRVQLLHRGRLAMVKPKEVIAGLMAILPFDPLAILLLKSLAILLFDHLAILPAMVGLKFKLLLLILALPTLAVAQTEGLLESS